MKILKIFGIVVGIHVFALVLIFANPGCSSTTKSSPAPTDTVARNDAPPVTMPNLTPTGNPPGMNAAPASSAPPISFNPDAPALAAPSASSSSGGGVRFTPTRPNTPVAGTLVSEPVVDVTPATTYAVKSGDSLWSIAKKHHLAVAELATANNLSTNAALRPGQKLVIPGKAASASVAATASGATGPTPKATEVAPAASGAAASGASRASGDAMKHTVKSGESLSTIARFYGVKQGDIAVANNISDPAKIKAGDQLIIPGYQTPVSKSGKGSKSGVAKSADTKASAAATEPAAPPPPVPVIKIDESPITPAPKP